MSVCVLLLDLLAPPLRVVLLLLLLLLHSLLTWAYCFFFFWALRGCCSCCFSLFSCPFHLFFACMYSTAKTLWRPEYGSFMLEATPGQPYQKQLSELLLVEPSMALRRATLEAMLKPGERLLMITAFPRMGVGVFTHPPLPPGGHKANSLYVPDAVINPHPRFGTLTRNIRKRRGSNISILVPLFMDVHTQLQPPLPSPARYQSLASKHSTPVQTRRYRADTAPRDSMHRVRSTSVTLPGTSQEHADASCASAASASTSTSVDVDVDVDVDVSGSDKPPRVSLPPTTGCSFAASAATSPSSCSTRSVTASSIIECVSKCGSAAVSEDSCFSSCFASSSSSSMSSSSSSSTSSSAEASPSAAEVRTRQEAGLWVPPALEGKVIHMDAMAFGMGACCLQCTYQCCSIDEAASHYDALAVLSPLFLALTAGCPVVRGMVADTDVRWHVIAASVDDRSPVERGLQPLDAKGTHAVDTRHRRRLGKSRYDSIDCYISPNSRALNRCEATYNDIAVDVDEDIYQYILKQGIARRLARHIAHLFVRDPLVMYSGQLRLDDRVGFFFGCCVDSLVISSFLLSFLFFISFLSLFQVSIALLTVKLAFSYAFRFSSLSLSVGVCAF
jgi:Glutamate-cysteine ligase